MFWMLLSGFLLLIKFSSCHKSNTSTTTIAPFITDYFHLVSTIDKPLALSKQHGMRQSSIDFYPGTMNIIFSVPHDGDLKSNLPTRPKGGCRKTNSTSKKCYYQDPCTSPKFYIDTKICHIPRGRDKNSRLLALALRYEFDQIFRQKPFVIINRLERIKVDMNRFIDEATFGVSSSMRAWMRYHFYLTHARETIVQHVDSHGGKGMLFDLHSHEHEPSWVELGYLINSGQLSTGKYTLKTSSLSSHLESSFDPGQIITGNKSLGHFITKHNYMATPSPTYPSPDYASYFEWGYTIEEYGRRDNFSAIMIESPTDELTNLTRLYVYAKSLALALHDYLVEIELVESFHPPTRIVTEQFCKNQAMQLNSERIGLLLLVFWRLIGVYEQKNKRFFLFHSNG